MSALSGDILLTRDQFREGVFARDKYTCVLCGDIYGQLEHPWWA